MELEAVDQFVEEMKKIKSRQKNRRSGEIRYQVILASGNERAVFQPTVTTSRVNTLLLRNASSADLKKIEEESKKMCIEIAKCLKFFFDEQKEPSN